MPGRLRRDCTAGDKVRHYNPRGTCRKVMIFHTLTPSAALLDCMRRMPEVGRGRDVEGLGGGEGCDIMEGGEGGRKEGDWVAMMGQVRYMSRGGSRRGAGIGW